MRRFSGPTVATAVLTAAVFVVQVAVPGTLERLERTPAALHGDWWRWLTSLLVQDGGWVGAVFNIAFLLLCGIAAEQVVSASGWVTAYVGTGLAGQVFGQLWQPTGAGNSVAVCGLVALLVVALATRPADVEENGSLGPSVWSGALAGAVWGPLLVVGVVLGLTAARLRARPITARVTVGFCLVCAVVLVLARDIHGGALAVGLVGSTLAAGLRRRSRDRLAHDR